MPSKNIVELKLKHESSMYHNAFSNIGSVEMTVTGFCFQKLKTVSGFVPHIMQVTTRQVL